MKLSNVLVRLAGLLTCLIPVAILIYKFGKDGASQHGELFTGSFYVSFIAAALFGIPGLYVASKGPLLGEVARENRQKGAKFVALGVAIFACGAGLNYLTIAIAEVLGTFNMVFLGLMGVGAVLVALGLVSLIAGRNLVEELS